MLFRSRAEAVEVSLLLGYSGAIAWLTLLAVANAGAAAMRALGFDPLRRRHLVETSHGESSSVMRGGNYHGNERESSRWNIDAHRTGRRDPWQCQRI